MIKISLENDFIEMNLKDVENLINRLPMRDQIRLIGKFRKEAWTKRLDEITKNIRERRKKHKIADHEIRDEIEKARDEFYTHHR